MTNDTPRWRPTTRRPWPGCGLAAMALMLLDFDLTTPAVAAPPTASTCALTTVAIVQARHAVDGRTFLLADGREVRLADIETPAPDITPAAGGEDRAAAARTALDARVAGRDIVLKHVAPATDRYGRLVMRAFVDLDGSLHSLAELLIAQGHALLARRPGEAACQRELVAAERAARAAKLGLWGDPRYELKRAQNPGEILAVRGRTALVEGRVLSVRESGGTIYVNFGRRWTEDFTVTISKRNERLFVAAGLAPKVLEGRRVRVRGVVEERGGPWIEAARPEQIELVDGN